LFIPYFNKRETTEEVAEWVVEEGVLVMKALLIPL